MSEEATSERKCPHGHPMNAFTFCDATMSDVRERWGWRDGRTGMRWSVTVVPTREMAEAELEGWRARDRRGKRPDLHDALPFVEVFRLGANED